MDTLEQIMAARRAAVVAARVRTSQAEIEREARKAPRAVNFLASIRRPGQVTIIAEMKQKSPSAGKIRTEYNVPAIAAGYEKGGAAALSVLTEPDRFGGDVTDLRKARSASKLPILRKDFIFDAYQIAEARAYGADAILLIADMLDPVQLKELVAASREFGVEPLVEIFTSEVLKAAIDSGATAIGINTRNLRTLEMHPRNVVDLAPHIPADRAVVAESGIKTAAEITALKSLKVSAALVGESLLRQADVEKAVRVLAEAGKS
jgi:indole-3-glycerol phosphate synthase